MFPPRGCKERYVFLWLCMLSPVPNCATVTRPKLTTTDLPPHLSSLRDTIDRTRRTNPAEALPLAIEGQQLAERDGNEHAVLDFLILQLQLHNQMADRGRQPAIFERAFALAESLGAVARQSDLLLSMSVYGRFVGEPIAERIEKLERARQLAPSARDSDLPISILNELATCHFQRGDLASVLEAAEAVIELRPNASFEANALMQIAHVESRIGEQRNAIATLERALDLVGGLGEVRIAEVLNGLGVCWLELAEFNTAERYFLEALQKIGNKPGRAGVLTHLGEVHLQHGDVERARVYFDDALAIHPSATVAHIIAIDIAECDRRSGHNAEAIQRLRKIEPDVTENFRHLSRGLFDTLWQSYEALGDTQNALVNLKQLHAIASESQSEQIATRLAVMNRKLTAERESFERERLRLHAEARAERLERELSTQAMSLAAQAELLTNLRNDLDRLVRQTQDPTKALANIQARLKELPCEQVDWMRFEGQFAAAHPGFKPRLADKFPMLSPMELRVCALLRLDLKSSDIARLFCITERAVEFHRLNLRKKFALRKGDDLREFLLGV